MVTAYLWNYPNDIDELLNTTWLALYDSVEIFDYDAFVGKYYNVDMKSMRNLYVHSIVDSLSELMEFFYKKVTLKDLQKKIVTI